MITSTPLTKEANNARTLSHLLHYGSPNLSHCTSLWENKLRATAVVSLFCMHYTDLFVCEALCHYITCIKPDNYDCKSEKNKNKEISRQTAHGRWVARCMSRPMCPQPWWPSLSSPGMMAPHAAWRRIVVIKVEPFFLILSIHFYNDDIFYWASYLK